MSREAMQKALKILERSEALTRDAIVELCFALSEPKKCKYGDPMCPCQDGDMCHYEGENPMTPPAKLTDEEILECLKEADPKTVRLPIGFKLFARAIEHRVSAPPGYVMVPKEIMWTAINRLRWLNEQNIADQLRKCFDCMAVKGGA